MTIKNPGLFRRWLGVMGLIGVLFLAGHAFGDQFTEKIRGEASALADAVVRADYDSVANYTLPLVLEKMGGKDILVQTMREGELEMKGHGVSFNSVQVGTPDPVTEVKGKLYTLVPQTSKMNVSQGVLVTESYMIAVSEDHGQKWYFIDAGGLDGERMKDILPDLVGKMVIPPLKQPTLVPKQ